MQFWGLLKSTPIVKVLWVDWLRLNMRAAGLLSFREFFWLGLSRSGSYAVTNPTIENNGGSRLTTGCTVQGASASPAFSLSILCAGIS